MFRQIDRQEIWARWHTLGPALQPAVDFAPQVSLAGVLDKLMIGQAAMLEVRSAAIDGVVVIEIIQENDLMICWASYIAGHIDLPPKAWLRAMRTIMGELERLARNSGCYAVRIGGRNYEKIFPDYRPFDDVPNRLQKVLLDG